METTIAAKTQRSRASSDDAFLERVYVCAPLFFCFMLKRTSLHTLFSYFFCALRLHSAAKTKESTTSFFFSFLHIYIHTHTYTRNKSHREFFFFESSDKPDRKFTASNVWCQKARKEDEEKKTRRN